MNKTNTPFRYDYVGSFLRPAALKQARADFQSGRIDAAALKAVEDDAIRDLVAKQKAAGYHVITDGEFRRALGTSISCGASTASATHRPRLAFRSRARPRCLTTPILRER